MTTQYIKIIGRVQGVGFRRWAERLGTRFGLSGWVRNMADGSVEVMAKGDSKALNEFLSACREGPSFALVLGIQPVVIPTTTPPPIKDGVFESVASS